MIRRCHIVRCSTRPSWFVMPSPAIAGVAGASACGTHHASVTRWVMAEYGTQWVRVRMMEGTEIASNDGPIPGDHPIGGDA